MRKVLLLWAFSIPVFAAPLYTIQAVGTAGIEYTGTVAISGSGAVAATAVNRSGESVALGFAADGSTTLRRTNAQTAAINGSGVVAGSVLGSDGSRATVWQNGGALALDIENSTGLGINEAGSVAGAGQHGNRMSAFVYSADETTWIDAGRWSAAYDINNQGQVAGTAERWTGGFVGFVWSAENGLRTLGTLGGTNSYAMSLNDAGVVVGNSMTRSRALHAFRDDGTGMQDLGTLGGRMSGAYGINSAGLIVGYSTDASGASRAFVWRDGMMFDLNQLIDQSLGWTLESAYGINDRGQIAGIGLLNGVSSAFVLNPFERRLQAEFPGQPVPEPSTWTFAGAGIAALAAVTWYRRVG